MTGLGVSGLMGVDLDLTMSKSGHDAPVNSREPHPAALVKYQPAEGPNQMTDTTTASPYLDTVQAAAYLHHAPRSLNNMRALGTGPRWHKAGGRVLYLRSDLESYIRSGLR